MLLGAKTESVPTAYKPRSQWTIKIAIFCSSGGGMKEPAGATFHP